MLLKAIEDVQNHRIDPPQAKAIAALAQQINASLAVELEVRKHLVASDSRTVDMGSLPLGEEVQRLPHEHA